MHQKAWGDKDLADHQWTELYRSGQVMRLALRYALS